MNAISSRPALMPADTPDYMAPAWAGCMSWAISQPAIVGAFRAATRNRWKPGRSGLDVDVAKAKGADRKFVEAFIRWANVELWGPMGAEAGADRAGPDVAALIEDERQIGLNL